MKHLTTPLDETTVRSLRVGDGVSISGLLYTGRDAVHHRLHQGLAPPVPLRGQIIYHCGPVMLADADGDWQCQAAGPTTSTREEPYQWQVIRDHGIRAVIGKGGMGAQTLAACREYGCVYLHAIGGAAQVYAQCVTAVEAVYWMDLGSPEAMWQLRVADFPAIVSIDSHGKSLHQDIAAASRQRLSDRWPG